MVKPAISRVVSILGLGGYVEEKAHRILSAARETGLTSGKTPSVIAAACVYLACVASKIEISAKQVANAAGVSDNVVRATAKKIAKALKQGR